MTTDSTARSDSALGGWRPIETCLVDEATRIFAFNGDRVGEVVAALTPTNGQSTTPLLEEEV